MSFPENIASFFLPAMLKPFKGLPGESGLNHLHILVGR